jgi:hypothetical protein
VGEVAIILVDGVAIPTPSEMSVGVMDLSKAERNANGLMLIERIATKQKLEFTWAFLTEFQLRNLLSAVSPVFFSVTYPDPELAGTKTGSFYVGDRNMGVLDFDNAGTPRYKDVSFNFIQR